MIRQIRQYLAIRSYLRKLSLDLVRRFGKESNFSIEQVTQIAQRSGFSMTFIAYAHAAFCSKADFEAYYKPLGVKCTYEGLRLKIEKRYFSGDPSFDALTIYNRFRKAGGDFYESGIGQDLL